MRSHGFASLLLGSTLWTGLYAARVWYSGGLVYSFLVWNLFLAWTPWLLALAVERALERGWSRSALGLAASWFFFLPNAPYVITDFLHLRVRTPVPLWFDVLLLGSASLVGLLAGAFSLRRIEHALTGRASSKLISIGVWLAIGAAGFGIYLGRFERLNSWDLVVHPLAVLASLGEAAGPRALVVTAACAGLLGVTYLGVADRSYSS